VPALHVVVPQGTAGAASLPPVLPLELLLLVPLVVLKPVVSAPPPPPLPA
jgi:hypothetical protein